MSRQQCSRTAWVSNYLPLSLARGAELGHYCKTIRLSYTWCLLVAKKQWTETIRCWTLPDASQAFILYVEAWLRAERLCLLFTCADGTRFASFDSSSFILSKVSNASSAASVAPNLSTPSSQLQSVRNQSIRSNMPDYCRAASRVL